MLIRAVASLTEAVIAFCGPNITGAKDQDNEGMKEAVSKSRPDWLVNPQIGFIVGDSGCVTGFSGFTQRRVTELLAKTDAASKKCFSNVSGNSQKVNAESHVSISYQTNSFEETCAENGKAGIRVYLQFQSDQIMCN